MNAPKKPAIWADAMLLATEIEVAVRGFPRYHKYTLGSDLRRQAAWVCRQVARAARFPERRTQTLEALVMAVEDLKITIQLAKEVQAFANFAQFQRVVEIAVRVGKQSGGWWKQARSAAPRTAGNMAGQGA
jgi:hypothetical protein